MIHRSLSKYNLKYTSYIGDGDAKLHKYLLENPPYTDVPIKKIEDVNHFAKRMLTRLNRVKQENKKRILVDDKRFGGKGHMTNALAIKFFAHQSI